MCNVAKKFPAITGGVQSDPLLRATATSRVSFGLPENMARCAGECGDISAACGFVLAEDFGVVGWHAFVEQFGFSVD